MIIQTNIVSVDPGASHTSRLLKHSKLELAGAEVSGSTESSCSSSWYKRWRWILSNILTTLPITATEILVILSIFSISSQHHCFEMNENLSWTLFCLLNIWFGRMTGTLNNTSSSSVSYDDQHFVTELVKRKSVRLHLELYIYRCNSTQCAPSI